MHNFQDITDLALDQQAAVQVQDASQLFEVTDRLLSSETERELYESKGCSLLQKQSGASQRTVGELAPLLSE
jgi:3-deoxy-D-manno-octulosonic-acid transferase